MHCKLLVSAVLIAMIGCSSSNDLDVSAIRAGDSIVPRLHTAGKWVAGGKIAIAMYAEHYRKDIKFEDVREGELLETQLTASGSIQFFNDQISLDEPQTLNFEHEC